MILALVTSQQLYLYSQATSHSYNGTRDSPLKLDYAFNATPRVVSSLQESRIVNREIG